MTTIFEKEIKFSPAFDKRHIDPSKNYGVHGVDCLWLLKGEKGVVQFKIFTNWYLPHIQEKLKEIYGPMATDLGYHSPVPIYEDQKPITSNCEFTNGPCYYDGSSLNAQKLFEILVEKGSEAVWEEMTNFYRSVFGD